MEASAAIFPAEVRTWTRLAAERLGVRADARVTADPDRKLIVVDDLPAALLRALEVERAPRDQGSVVRDIDEMDERLTVNRGGAHAAKHVECVETSVRLRPEITTQTATCCAPGRTRTYARQIRRLLLYPLSYGGSPRILAPVRAAPAGLERQQAIEEGAVATEGLPQILG